jgi:hypothetical protein
VGGTASSFWLQAETARARRAALRREYFMLCFPYRLVGNMWRRSPRQNYAAPNAGRSNRNTHITDTHPTPAKQADSMLEAPVWRSVAKAQRARRSASESGG